MNCGGLLSEVGGDKLVLPGGFATVATARNSLEQSSDRDSTSFPNAVDMIECRMSLTITIPDEVAAALGATHNERQQRAREAIALDLYREGRITLRVMGRLAGTGEDYWAANAFRVQHGLPVN